MARNYSNVAVQTALSSPITDSATTLAVGSVTGYPSAPFTIIVDPGLATEELIEVGNISGTSFTSCIRGVDGTPAQAHSTAAVVVHGTSARDFREPNDHVAATTNVHGLSGGAGVVGTTTAQTLTNKTLTSPTLNSPTINSPTFGGSIPSVTLTTPTITTPAITGGTWSGGTLSTATLTSPTIGNFTNANHTHVDAATGGTLSQGGGFAIGYFYTETGAGTFSASSLTQIGSDQYTFTAPASWPSGASRIVFHMQFEASSTTTSDARMVMCARLDSTDYYQWSLAVPDAASTFYVAQPAALPSAGSHTVKLMARMQFSTSINVFSRSIWATLI